jgi:hypothetical protein
MNKRPGHIKVTTDPGYCSFCDRTRNLRREEHQLGTFVRTVVTCETCHRTLSSTMGVASAEAPVNEQELKVEGTTPAAPKVTPASNAQPAKRAAAARKTKPASSKPTATKARTTRTK